MKRYLGLDLGSKTLGVAISESGLIASVYKTIRFVENNYDDALEQLVPVIDENKITTVILGLPKHMNNDLGIRGEISTQFKAKILEKRNVEVILWDERLSTQAVKKVMVQAIRRSKQKTIKDELAAVLILQNYLDSKGA
ncbi:MAG: Holliday junction resolvase RuvX [Acholeplasmataceae bacterium]